MMAEEAMKKELYGEMMMKGDKKMDRDMDKMEKKDDDKMDAEMKAEADADATAEAAEFALWIMNLMGSEVELAAQWFSVYG